MTTYLILYRSKVTAAEQMASATPEQGAESMKAWTDWAERAGSAVVDLGAPLQTVEAGGDQGDPVGGYSIMQADSAEALQEALKDHPHTAWGGTIEILECLSMPGT